VHPKQLAWRVLSTLHYRKAPPRTVVESVAEFTAACGPEAEVRELPSPAPNAEPRPPGHLGSELHPVFEDLLVPWNLQDICVAVLPGARLETADGVVVRPDGSVLAASAWDPDQLRKSGIFDRQPRRSRRIRGTHASIVSQFTGHFHWLTEALPRIAALRLVGLGDVPLIVPSATTGVRVESLELLGVERWKDHKDGLAPDVLVWPRPVGHTGHPPRWACLWLREQLLGPQRRPGTARLYISRRDVWRRVLNEAEVVALLRRHGFDVVQPELLTLAEQAELFGGAAVVVGPHGAGNANVLFAGAATLIELFHPRLLNGCFYSLCQALGHSYWYLMCDREGEWDIRVPIDQLEELLSEALGAETDQRRKSAGMGE
jgi:capsular polysaccharide biosynthesis protein